MKLKEVFDSRCKFRVADFETAAQKSDLNIMFSGFSYHEGTLFIWKASGIVTQGSSRIRVDWNYAGFAFIGSERMPEFDLKLSN